jgi:hypothetical protein
MPPRSQDGTLYDREISRRGRFAFAFAARLPPRLAVDDAAPNVQVVTKLDGCRDVIPELEIITIQTQQSSLMMTPGKRITTIVQASSLESSFYAR